MKKELKKYLEEMIENEWNRYRSELLEESSRKIERDNDIYVNCEDNSFLGTEISFDTIFKFNNKLYGLYLIEPDGIDHIEIYQIIEVNPMILLDDNYKEDEYMTDDLIFQYQIKETGFSIEKEYDFRTFNGERYECDFKPVLREEK